MSENTSTEPTDDASETIEAPETETFETLKAENDRLKAESEKQKALGRKSEDRAKSNAQKAKDYDALVESQKSDQDKAVEAARKEGAAEALAMANTRLVTATAKALVAAGSWAVSPAAVLRNLDLSSVKVDAEGDVDEAAISALLETLATDEPGLVRDAKAPPVNRGGGASPEPKTPVRGLGNAITAKFTSSL